MTDNKYPVFDGHNDLLLDYIPFGQYPIEEFFTRHEDLQVDFPRAKEGGFAGGFFAVFIPDDDVETMLRNLDDPKNALNYEPPALDLDKAQSAAMTLVANLFRMEAASKGQFRVVRTADELEHCLQNDIMAAILHFEGAEPIDTDLNALEVYYQAGLRSLGFVWSRPTPFAYGVPFGFPRSPDTGPGLTDAGKALVKACNELGIMIDLSHLNEKGFWDVAKLSDAPLVATHSCAHALSQSTRNLTDKQLDAIKESDGMVGVNFFVGFLREDGKPDTRNTTVDEIVRHFDYLVERLGMDRVGFGSDYGVTPVPDEIRDVSRLPRLIDALKKAGYDDAALRKLTHENWVRVLRKTWK